MSEDAMFILIMLFWATAIYAAYQKFFVVRRLRKRIDSLVDAAVSAQPANPTQTDHGELRRVQERLRVLERIAVEKENSLSREIEGLHAAGR